MIYGLLPLIWAGQLPNMAKLVLVTIILSAVTSKAAHFYWPFSAVWNVHRQQQERSYTCPLPCFYSFFYWQPKDAGFHTFSGTFAAMLPTVLNNILNNIVLCGSVCWRKACAWHCPLLIIERLVGQPTDPLLLCYLRADKGGRCEEEINVNPSVFN